MQLLLLHGSEDGLIPPSHSTAILASSATPEHLKHLALMEGCGHNSFPLLFAIGPELKKFLDTTRILEAKPDILLSKPIDPRAEKALLQMLLQ